MCKCKMNDAVMNAMRNQFVLMMDGIWKVGYLWVNFGLMLMHLKVGFGKVFRPNLTGVLS